MSDGDDAARSTARPAPRRSTRARSPGPTRCRCCARSRVDRAEARRRACPTSRSRCRTSQLDPGHVADYARVCGFSLRDALPPTYLHMLAFPLAMRLMTDGAFPFGVLGPRARREPDRARAAGDDGETLSFRVHAEDLRDHPRGRQFDMVVGRDGRRRARVGGALDIPAARRRRRRARRRRQEAKDDKKRRAARRRGDLEGPGRHRPPLRRGLRRPQPDPPAQPVAPRSSGCRARSPTACG